MSVVPADPRALRTRRAIYDAVERLAADIRGEDDPDDIGVSDIVRVAGISRSSFYVHFDDVADVASGLLGEAFGGIADAVLDEAADRTGADAARRGYTALVDHLVDRYGFYARLRNLPSLRGAHDDAVVEVARDLHLRILARIDLATGTDADFLASYAAGGILTVVGGWLAGRLDGTDEELIDRLVAQLPAAVASAELRAAPEPAPAPTRPTTKGTT